MVGQRAFDPILRHFMPIALDHAWGGARTPDLGRAPQAAPDQRASAGDQKQKPDQISEEPRRDHQRAADENTGAAQQGGPRRLLPFHRIQDVAQAGPTEHLDRDQTGRHRPQLNQQRIAEADLLGDNDEDGQLGNRQYTDSDPEKAWHACSFLAPGLSKRNRVAHTGRLVSGKIRRLALYQVVVDRGAAMFESMGDDVSIFTTVLFAIIAGVVIFRLRGVLGKRTGSETQRPNPFVSGLTPPKGTVEYFPPRPEPEPEEMDGPVSLAAGLARIHKADPKFDENAFLNGARTAFEHIIQAYVQGDRSTLKSLLSASVFASFDHAIAEREKASEAQEIRIEKFEDVDVREARLDGSYAYVTVRFVTQQIKVTRDKAGEAIDGDAAHAVEMIDLWTFSRDTGSSDPNWLLVATRTL
jgi:predicted lipid-binding transport protein (Tim44 family)